MKVFKYIVMLVLAVFSMTVFAGEFGNNFTNQEA